MPVKFVINGRVTKLGVEKNPNTKNFIPKNATIANAKHDNGASYAVRPRMRLQVKTPTRNLNAIVAANTHNGKLLLVNVDLICEHFGVNTPNALRLAVNLTANAIRSDKAKVTL